MKKVFMAFTFIMAAMGVVFTILAFQKYDDTKNNKSMKEKLELLEKRKTEAQEKVKENEKEKETIKQEKEESVKELESWQKRLEEIENNL